MFADRGLSAAEVSSLFAIWSVVAFVCEVPSGALADVWSRKRLYAIGELLTAAGYGVWLSWPTYPGFAVGFVLWGVGGSLGSGALEALVYDELAAEDRAGDYARVTGRAGTVEILAMLAATLLAAPAWQAGGYLLVGAASIASKTLGGLLALRLPENRAPVPVPVPDPDPNTGPDEAGHGKAGQSEAGQSEAGQSEAGQSEAGYAATLRAGVRAALRSRRVAWAVLVAALVPGFSALDEYLPLLSRDKGATTAAVPLLFAGTALAMAAGSALAGRFAAPRSPALPGALTAAAVLLAVGALLPHLAGMAAVSAAFGLLQFAMVLAETRLQDTITGPARSTVLSVAGFASEVFAVALYAVFALPVPLPLLVALTGVPLLLTALTATRR